MADRDFLLPDLGEGLTEGEIVRWLVAVGDTVAVDQPVAEIETAKAIVEVPTPFAGVVATLHGAEGEEIRVGQPLLTVDVAADGSGAVSASGATGSGATGSGATGSGATGSGATGSGAASSAGAGVVGSAPGEAEVSDMVPEAAAAEDGASGSVLVGYGTGGGARVSRRRGARNGRPAPPPLPPPAPSPPNVSTVDDVGGISPRSSTLAMGAGPVGSTGRPLAKPPVRKLAKDLGVDLYQVTPSGADGVITREDVQAAVNGNGHAAAWPADGAAAADERIPIRGVRKRIAERMSTSRREIPEATTWVDCDATELMRLREQLNAAEPDARVSPLALVLRIVVAGLREHRVLNASIDGEDIVLHGAVHLGVAAQTERGLMVPVIRDAHARPTRELAAELNRLAEGARAGTLTPAELTGSTFTVSNFGSFGVDGGNPVINHPEAAILGVGRIADRPWVHDGELAVRKVLQLSIAFDHRIADGGEAAGFLRWVADRIEHPALLLASL